MADDTDASKAGVSRRSYLKAGAAGLASLSFATGAAAGQEADAPGTANAGGATLIKGGTVVTVDPDHGVYDTADVLVRGGEIRRIEPNISAPGADVIDASDAIVVPGFVNAHLHTWESGVRGVAGNWTFMEYLEKMLGNISSHYRPEDAYLGNLFGAVQQLNAGTTTILDWFHIANTPDHTDRAIDGLQDAGVRALFTHGPPGDDSAKWWENSSVPHPDDIRRLARERFPSDDGLLTLAMGARGPDYSTDEVTRHDIELARELGIPVSMHIGSLGPGGVAKLDDLDLLGNDLNYVHANRLTDEEFRLMGASGGSISTTAEVELQMGMGMPAIGDAVDAGATPSVGVDIVSNVSDDLFTQLRTAVQVERGLRNQPAVERGEQIQDVTPTAHRALEYATIEGARALGLADRIGSLTPGKRADITIIDGEDLNTAPVHNPVETVVFQAGIENVDTVLVDGTVVKRNGLVHNATAQNHLDRLEQSGRRILRQADL
ncbi:cytosine/adenosine deaminase-related metal-dependent hydrolase [Halarchaeum rubridurum]|uniref:Cytosine deaminase n=1 Tax=Halarchaeum rubridurum TaxID=489911 RepID=A0A830FYW5_9EURY|nr:amidohydrolase family protein [Halarchaeum rubridurum]MBP1954602.1 cytosine/adenosine deaminase-related metal-dependent hydrolase [Halarchaeum rubridurum]GGM62383.1 cytosine deaminase [Halarchaeum rubridurum]